MSETELHKRLVQALAKHVRLRRSGCWLFFVDSKQNEHSQGCPPILGDACPDVYAREDLSKHLIIGEAKTALDIDNLHTKKQLMEYFNHLSEQDSGELIMAVPLMSAGAAHRLCRLARLETSNSKVPFEITGWMFGSKPIYEVWHG